MSLIKSQKRVIYFFVLLGIHSCFNSAFAQEAVVEDLKKNVIYVNAGHVLPFLVTASVNYERLIKTNDNWLFSRCYVHTGFGLYRIEDWSGPDYGLITNLTIKTIAGKRSSHLELGIGFGIAYRLSPNKEDLDDVETIDSDSESEPSDSKLIYPSATIGYRYQKPNGLIVRTGIALPDGFYVSIGYAF